MKSNNKRYIISSRFHPEKCNAMPFIIKP